MPEPVGPRLRYNPALDGIRAFAVLAVIGVHETSWLPGGFYGVDAFFALSGFLITSLLVTEWQGSGGIALGRFWIRRARRLLPALYVLVVAVGVVAAVWPATLSAPHLVSDGLATLFYSANWYLVAQHASYFTATAAPSPLQHTWSLAIEEQFYLVWPLVVLAVLGRGRRADGPEAAAARRRRRLGALLVVSAVGAVCSAVLMALVSPAGSVSNHAYYGTDTRMQGLLVGATLALAFTLWEAPTSRRAQRRAHRGFGSLAILGAAGTAVLWARVPETSALAFHGGFFLAALCTAAVIAGAVRAGRGVVARGLALAPLRALGRISYGVYLWYWPVLLVMTGARVHLGGTELLAARVAVTVAIAAVSYRLVERPIRHGSLPGWRAAVAAPVGVAAGLVAMMAATLVPATAAPAAPAAPAVPRAALSAAHGDTRPVKVLLVGDSVAGSLGVGLSLEAPRYGVALMNEGTPGCSLSMDQAIDVLFYSVPPDAPCRAGDPDALLAQWQRWVRAWNPDVVVYLARGEVFNQEVGGQWTDILQAGFDRYLLDRYRKAIDVLGGRGAAVVLMTTPLYDSGAQEDGAPWPEDDPRRVAEDNALIDRAARLEGGPTGPHHVTVYRLSSLLTPDGRYRSVVDGVTTRCTDGVHFTAAAGTWLASRLFPVLVRLGAAHRTASPTGAWAGPAPAAVPHWWTTLPCG